MNQFDQRNKTRFSRTATWLLPGLQLKRWLGILVIGIVCISFGVALLLNMRPITLTIELVKNIATVIPSWISGTVLVFAGAVMMLLGWRKATGTFFGAIDSSGDMDLLEALYRRNKLDRGPNIVAIGGGTGLSTLLRGIKHYTSNLTAIVTVADDGGSSGRLRQEFGIVAPGDIRNCIAALADEEHLITELFQYRFDSGEGLQGHSFGNLFLSVLCSITGNMVLAVRESSKVLNIRGRVLPATLENVALVAEMEDGRTIRGESQIPEAKAKIKRMSCDPANAAPCPEVIEAIANAELIILGPGSLFTSVLPNLLIPDVAKALSASKAPKIYVCNVMSQPGETDNMSVADHVSILLDHCPGQKIVDAVVVNNWIPEALVNKYNEHGSYPVVIDRERLQTMGIKLIERILVDDGETIRHNPKKLSRSIIQWYKKSQRPHHRRKLGQASENMPAKSTLSGSAV